jgi:FemAB-related protein (PEP-CTERM system-associated)
MQISEMPETRIPRGASAQVASLTNPPVMSVRDGERADPAQVIVSHLTARLRDSWTKYVATAPGTTFFHQLEWQEAVQEIYGHTPRSLIAYSSTTCRVNGILPLFEVSGPLTGRALISIPYAVYGGVAADSPAVQSQLLEAAKSLADRRGVNYLEIRQGTALEGFADRCHYFTFRKRMPASTKDILATYPGKARTAIRQAISTYNLAARTGLDNFDAFYRLYVVSLRRLASPPHKKEFFERLLEKFGSRCLVHVVYAGATPVAGAIALKFKDSIAPYFVGLDRDYARMNTSNFLYYSLMVHAIESGLSVFDLGRTRQDNAGGCQFKVNQGFQPEPLHYEFYSPSDRPAPDLRHSNPKFAIAKAVWQKLPLRCVALAGGIVTRWIP